MSYLYFSAEADAATAAAEIYADVVTALGETPASTTGWAVPEPWSGRWRIPDVRGTTFVTEGEANEIVDGLSVTPIAETMRDPVMALPELAVATLGPSPGAAANIGTLAASGNYTGFVALPDGRLIAGPRSATTMLLYDPATDTYTQSNFGASLPGSGSHYAGTLGCDGKAYFAPSNSSLTLVFDPETDTATLTNFGIGMMPAGSGRFAGFVANRGRTVLVGIPSDATYILLVYPATQTAEIWVPAGCDLTGTSKFRGGVLGHDGRIYAAPFTGDNGFLVVDVRDLDDKTAFRSTLGATIPSGSTRWASAVLFPDGRAVWIPFTAQTFAIVDTVAGTATMDTLGLTMSNSNKWAGGALGLDMRGYGAPYGRNTVLIIDLVAGTATEVESLAIGSAKCIGAVTAPDGRVFCAPLQASTIPMIAATSGNDLSDSTILSPYMNRF